MRSSLPPGVRRGRWPAVRWRRSRPRRVQPDAATGSLRQSGSVRTELTVSPASRRRTMSSASSKAEGRVLMLAPIAANRSSPQPSPHCMTKGPSRDSGQCPDLLRHQHRVPQREQEQATGRSLAPLSEEPPEHRRVLIIWRGRHVLITDKQRVRAMHGGTPRLARSSSAPPDADLSSPGGCLSARSRPSLPHPFSPLDLRSEPNSPAKPRAGWVAAPRRPAAPRHSPNRSWHRICCYASTGGQLVATTSPKLAQNLTEPGGADGLERGRSG